MNEKANDSSSQQPQPKEEKIENDLIAKEMLSLQNNLKECEEKYLRLLAESENARKRMIKEREELTQFAIERVIVEFLQPLDNFEKALKFAESVSPEIKSWALGFEMILAQFKQVLSSHGITEYESQGKHFDPHLHEAIEVVEAKDNEPGTILQEFHKGYKRGDRIVRVATVKVAKSPTPTEKKEPSSNQESTKKSEE